MALQMKRLSFLCHIFKPGLCSVAAPKNPYPSYFSALFSTLKQNITPLQSPFADFAATRLNLSSADIARMLKKLPSLDTPKTLQNVQLFIHFLTKYGCTQHQIGRIMRSQPTVVTINAEKLVEPKIELLKDLGFEEKDVPKFLLTVPAFLSLSLQHNLLPKIRFLKSFLQSQSLLVKAVKIDPFIFTYSLEKSLRPSLDFWMRCGLQREELASFLSSRPFLLRNPSLTPSKVDLIQKIGICKENNMYKHVLGLVATARMETLESKIDNFRQWGLSVEEIWELFRISPSVFHLSEDKVREKMDFVVRTMKLPPNSVVKHSLFLRHSLEKVVRPRFVVFQHMKSLNGIEHLKSKQLQTLIGMSKTRFVNTFLKGHPESETLCALHENAILNV